MKGFKTIVGAILFCALYFNLHADECCNLEENQCTHCPVYCCLDTPCFCWGSNGRPCCWHDNGCICGYWFPEEPALYQTMLADPRQISYSIGWRFDDQALNKDMIDVSFGDTLSIYQWTNVWLRRSVLRVDVEGAVWAIFAPRQESAPLVNADYYVGIPLTYAWGPWSFRLRAFHISSHIGDEFMLMHPRFLRKNPSAEYVDFFTSYDFCEDFRLFGGIGWIVAQDETFKCHPFYAAAGIDVRLRSLCGIDWCNLLYGSPFFGIYIRYSPDFKKHIDATYALGYEWMKLSGLFRKVRVYLEYHDGYSLEGQFCHSPTNYFSLRASYGF